MKKGFQSKRLMALLMAAVMSVNSLPVTAFAAETNLIEQSQTESVMESETAEETFADEKETESITEEESVIEETAEEESVLEESDQEEEFSLLEEDTKADDGLIDSGTCGENVTWTLDNEGVLTISGTGAMTDYYDVNDCPWVSKYNDIVSKVVIENGVTNIGDDTIIFLSSLVSVEIPNSVTKIGKYAFRECPKLNVIDVAEENQNYISVDGVLFDYEMATLISCPGADRVRYVIPEGITTIGEYAFNSCRKMTEVDIPDSVLYIDACAFEECYKLTDVEIPDSVISIGLGAFSRCSSLTNIKIPESITSMADCLFDTCTKLTSIEIPDSVVSIGTRAFDSCRSLAEIEIPNSVKSIGRDAFEQCTSLKNIKLPEELTKIEGYTFSSCSNLSGIEFPKNITSIEDSAFSSCSSLISIELPEGLTSIGDSAFSNCSSLSSVKLPEGVTSIGYQVFSNCSSLSSIKLPEGVTSIGGSAFSGCSSLSDIELPKGVTNIGSYAFSKCSSLSSIELPEGVTSIKEGVFENCTSLLSVDIPDKVISIGVRAFGSCSILNTIRFKGFAPQIEADSFENVTATVYYPENISSWTEENRKNYGGTLTWEPYTEETLVDAGTCGRNLTWELGTDGTLTISGTGSMNDYGVKEAPWYPYKEEIVSVIIEEGVNCIGNYAFYQCSKLKSVKVPDSLYRIYNYAFSDCSSLESIEIPENVRSIGVYAFSKCSSLKSIKIPGNVTSIGAGVFSECSSLESAEIEENITEISGSLFRGCNNLKSVKIPDSVASIGVYAFKGCSSLKNIELPENVESIGSEAFRECSSLESISIPKNVAKIDDYTFYNCTNLKAIDISNGVEDIGKYAFYGCSSLESVELPKSVTSIGEYVFYECSGLKNVGMSDGLESIGRCAFYKCSSLEKIDIPDSVTSMGDSVFYECSSLKSVKISDNVTSVERDTFYNCSELANVNIPKSAESIGEYAFWGCSSLESVEIPENVTNIDVLALKNCINLRIINVDKGNQTYCSKNGVLFNYDMTVLVDFPEMNSEKYSIPDGVKFIGQYAFAGSRILKEVEFPETLMVIVRNAFGGCDSLTKIEIPARVLYIGEEAFYNCSSLTDITFKGFAPVLGLDKNIFYGATANVHYPANDLSWSEEIRQDYGGSLTWSTYTPEDIVDSGTCGENMTWSVSRSGLLSINGNGAMMDYTCDFNTLDMAPWFSEYPYITSVVIEDGMTHIGDGAFLMLVSITDVDLPKSIVSVGNGAFSQCSNLKEISFNSAAPTFEESSFADVTATVYYPANDPSWTEEVRQNYGGTLTWVEKEVEPEEKELTILKQPESVTGKIGDTAIFTVEADGDDIAYQWQYCNSGSSIWKNSSMAGADTNSIEVKITKGRIGQKYRCILKDSRENQLITEEAQINQLAEKKLVITKQPKSITGKIGDTAVFVVEAEGEGVTYQWQYCNSGSSTWKNSSMTGSTTNSIEVKITKGRIGQKYRCILKDSKGNKLTTEEVQIIQAEEKKLAILQQPESVTGKIGETAVFTVEAEGEGVTYQWQYCNSGSSSWKNSSMTGSTTNSIEVKITKGRIGQKYRCIMKDSKGNKLTTEEAQIIQAEEKKLVIIQQPESVTGKIGETAVFTVEAEGEGVTYQWQYCNSGSTSWANSKMTGYDTNNIEVKITKGRIGQKYRCILKDSKGNKLTTEEVQIIQAEK